MNIISTKLSPPPLRADAVERPHLLRMLAVPSPSKVTLLSAPAGFGKTTLLSQWFADTGDACEARAWLGLDPDDGLPRRFLGYLLAACTRGFPAMGRRTETRLEAATPGDIAELLPDLVADLADVQGNSILFIDDAHHAAQPETAHFLELLCNLSPSGFRLAMAGRMRPGLPVASLRVRGQLREITSAQLRFDRGEAESFLRSVDGVTLTPAQIDRLHERSEGWIAGLQLASLSLRDQGAPDDFIEAFSGNLRDVAEYLATDVLDRQPPALREFLLRTCVLGRFNAEACAALTGAPDARERLEALEDRNLFLLPLDGERDWYRYHQLFQEFLQGQLRRRMPGEVVGLYQRAADWFSASGHAAEAVEYALLSGDMNRAAALIAGQVQQELRAGRMPRVSDWIGRLPAAALAENAVLLKANATALYHMNRPDEAAAVTDLLVRRVGAEHPDVRLLRAGISMCRDDVADTLTQLTGLGTGMSSFDLGTLHNIRGYAEMETGLFSAARASLESARQHHLRGHSGFGVAYAECFLGLLDLAHANPDAAMARLARAGSRSDSAETYVAPVPAVMRGVVAYERGQWDTAATLLRPHVPVLEQVGHIKLLTLGRLALGKLALREGDWERLHHHFDRCLELGAARGAHLGRLGSLVESERIRLLLAHGRADEARDRARAMGVDPDASPPALPDRWERVACLRALGWCRLQAAMGHARAALPVLERLVELAHAATRWRRKLECQLALYLASHAAGDPASGTRLRAALETAAPGRLVMACLDEGPAVHAALRAWPANSQDPLARFVRETCAILDDPRQGGTQDPGRDAFSARERDILRLVAGGHSNGDIAEQLAISENTVKWHLKNLFQKLEVRNRTAAVAAARRLNWV